MSEERLKQIEERLSHTTKGPWTYRFDHNPVTGCSDCHLIEGPPAEFAPDNPVWREMFRGGRVIGRSHGDALFLANSRQDIEDLVAEVRRLRRLADAMMEERKPRGAEK